MWNKRSWTENAGIQRNNEERPSTGKETLTTPHNRNWEKRAVRHTRRQKCQTVSQNTHETEPLYLLWEEDGDTGHNFKLLLTFCFVYKIII